MKQWNVKKSFWTTVTNMLIKAMFQRMFQGFLKIWKKLGMPGSAMIGLIPLTFACIGLFLYCWYKLAFWLGLPRHDKAAVAPMLREVGNCKRTME